MANKTIDSLPNASQINDNDLFVLQQNASAKKLAGELLKQYINVIAANGIKTAVFNANDQLVITLQDDTVITSASLKGQTGPKGDTGDDGVSPTLSASKVNKVTTITYTDAQHPTPTTLATINDGADGQGTGDMLKSTYDSDSSVGNAGGIKAWVNAQGYLTSHQSLSAYRTSAEQDVIDNEIKTDVDAIEAKIPAQATSSNQLADKNFVNSSIATETAHYISNSGEPFTSVAQLEAYSGTVTNNDYAFVTGTDAQGNTYFDRYKATVSGSTVTWAKEYRLNNSSFTAAQWSAISSGITGNKVSGYDAHVADSAIHVTSSDKSTWNSKSSKSSVITGMLNKDNWSDNQQVLAFPSGTLPTSGYAYIVSPEHQSFRTFASSQVYADDVTIADQMTFHCDTVPQFSLNIVILKQEVV